MGSAGKITRLGALGGAIAVLGVVHLSCSRQPEALIASSFIRHRNSEIRLPQVPYAKQLSLKTDSLRSSGGPELAEAEAVVLRGNRPTLLSRIHLLRSRWDEAVDAARAAYEADGSGADLDLGIAHLARGLAKDRPRDLEFAGELLSEVIARKPTDPIALFNRAIAFERLFLYRRAIVDCQQYLAIDASSGWAAEVRDRLRRIRQTVSSWENKREWFDASEDVYRRDRLKAPPELFLDSAMIRWLPHLSDAGAESGAREALSGLAEQLATTHHDTWLADLLSGPQPPDAIRALAVSVKSNQDGRRDEGLKQAREARRVFERNGNLAGAVRAGIEEIYALSRSFRIRDCLIQAAALERQSKARRYHWVRAQLLLEESACAFHNGEFETARKRMEAALEQISASGYQTLYLRGIGLQASLFHTQLGNTASAVSANWRGLELFWKGTHPPIRAHQFYSDLSMAAEREQRWRSAFAFAQEAVEMIALGPNTLMEAMARSGLAAFAERIGENNEALSQTQLASRLLDSFNGMRSTREYRLGNQIILASAYLANGKAEKAAETLASLNSGEEGDSLITRLALRRTYGLLYDQRKDWTKARQYFLSAAEVSRSALSNLHDDAARLHWKREADLVFRRLARIALEHESKESALGFWEWFRSAPVLNRIDPVPQREGIAEDLQRRLASYSEATVISWAQIDDRLAIWVYDDRRVRFAWSPAPVSRCKQLCARFARLCARPDSSLTTLRKSGEELYAALFAPVAADLDTRRILLVEPDAVPGAVAFEALVHPDGRWLGEHFTIVTSPGLWAEAALRPAVSTLTRSSSPLIVGNPLYSGPDFLIPLPDAEREAEFVRSLFPTGNALMGSAATSAAVISALPSAEAFHFTGHARFDGESARLLLAGEGGVLDSGSVENSVRRCKLAVLSACSTAGSERDGPWNVESLVQAFWRAGTPQVIASRWNVDAAITARMFTQFYTQLLAGANAAESLRRATEFIRNDNVHPYFWAAFHVFGTRPERRR